jgi:protocatechuate 3,4-dioxygenase beta subunit
MMIAALLAALSLSQAPAPAATGRLSGRVTAEGTNAPIAGARVMVFPMMRAMMPTSGPVAMPPQAMTDQDGRFVIDGISAGEYRIDVQRTGFASSTDPMARPKTYTVAAGQTLEISIALQKGAVITGKVLDQKGEPVTDAHVMALRRITPPGATTAPPRLIPAPMQGPQQTNDIGEYRVSGLPAGEYFLAASPRGIGFGGPGMPANTGHGGGTPTATTTYYPGTVDQAGAQSITVAAGAEVSNIVFVLQSAPAYRVSGIVVDENGAPVARAMVILMSDSRGGMMFMGPGGNAQTGDDGRFSIGDITPGTYRLNVSVPMIVTSSGGTAGGGGIAGGGVGFSEVSAGIGGGSFTSWSVSSSGGVTTSRMVNAAPQQPQEVVVADADVKDVRLVARRPPTPQ